MFVAQFKTSEGNFKVETSKEDWLHPSNWKFFLPESHIESVDIKDAEGISICKMNSSVMPSIEELIHNEHRGNPHGDTRENECEEEQPQVNISSLPEMMMQVMQHVDMNSLQNIGNQIASNLNIPSLREELKVADELQRRQLEFEKDYVIEGKSYRYDFKTGNYLIEFDGDQHFEFSAPFHRNQEEFEKQQQKDRLKTKEALDHGFVLIRIYSLDKISSCLDEAFKQKSGLYVSSPNKYQYLNSPDIIGKNVVTNLNSVQQQGIEEQDVD